MSRLHTYRSALKEALALTGGEAALSVRLKVSTDVLKNWLDGEAEIPDHAFLDAVDVITLARLREFNRSLR